MIKLLEHKETLVPAAIALSDAPEETYINAQKADGCTALHLAAASDLAEMVDLLVQAGADFTIKNRNGLTPLDVRCKRSSSSVPASSACAGSASRPSASSRLDAYVRCALATLRWRELSIGQTQRCG